ncbi:MAG: 4Fe-4S dicluster domain-containing protein [Betaproteobacteria bacterium]|nr:4Fe-4S dicluster domain-containing protein [Betaproteobacteria bacterium]
MSRQPGVRSSMVFLPRERLSALMDHLRSEGYRCLGPVVRDGAIQFASLAQADEFPIGWRDRQEKGSYALQAAGDARMFAFANGPQGLKPWLFAPRETLWRVDGRKAALAFEPAEVEDARLAVIGARSCDLAAMAIQDRHFLGGERPDGAYAARREGLFVVAVNCTHASATCFCASTGDGPATRDGFDIALTELDDGFVAASGSERGARALADLGLASAGDVREAEARARVAAAGAAQTRALPGRDLQAALFANLMHPRWDEVAGRCLSCGNCALVCPTCFCHCEREEVSGDGTSAEHYREWDSCFSEGHASIHGRQVRPDIRSRYRQWLTHKLGSWHDQFGRSGCVGCGRCITWCPVGIDITEEAAAVCGAATP